jgi:hypothetical protein
VVGDDDVDDDIGGDHVHVYVYTAQLTRMITGYRGESRVDGDVVKTDKLETVNAHCFDMAVHVCVCVRVAMLFKRPPVCLVPHFALPVLCLFLR